MTAIISFIVVGISINIYLEVLALHILFDRAEIIEVEVAGGEIQSTTYHCHEGHQFAFLLNYLLLLSWGLRSLMPVTVPHCHFFCQHSDHDGGARDNVRD